MKKIEITFERGGVFTADLLVEEAPMTCQFILEHLPLTLPFQHSTTSGQAVVGFPVAMTPKPENQRTVGIFPGSLCYLVCNPPMHVPDEIYISTGPYFIPRGFRVDYQEPVNVFGKIEGNLEQLANIEDRILKFGVEKVMFRLIDE